MHTCIILLFTSLFTYQNKLPAIILGKSVCYMYIYIYIYMQWLITKLSLNLLVLHTGAVQVRPDLRLYICWERVGSRWLSLWLPCTILLKIPFRTRPLLLTPERSNGGVRLKYVRISLHLVGFRCR